MMTGKWNEKMSYQPCDAEGEPLPGTELKEVCRFFSVLHFYWPLLGFCVIILCNLGLLLTNIV